MRRIRLIVSYDGTNYCGWQIQENAVTVEGTLTDALRKWLKEDIEIIGAHGLEKVEIRLFTEALNPG